MLRRAIMLAAACGALGGCAAIPHGAETSKLPVYAQQTPTQKALAVLPPPGAPVAVAVYGFTDQTGQFKPSDTGQTLSRAVTQGASSMLVKSLQDVGQRRWFTVVEREQLKNLLQERQIIREMRERYLGETGVNPGALPALMFAGVLLEGGVIGYDSNTLTGGAGAGFLGISAQTKYRQDTVTVYLRAVSVKTGEVLSSVTTSKTIASFQVGANAFRYVGFKELLEAEAGYTTNEPDQLALQQAIEKAVYGLVLEGVELGLWNFADPRAGWPFLYRHRQERDGLYTAEQMQAAQATLARPQARQARADIPSTTSAGPPTRRAPTAANPSPPSTFPASAVRRAPG
jgi:curli production assembly/transport component CsgG